MLEKSNNKKWCCYFAGPIKYNDREKAILMSFLYLRSYTQPNQIISMLYSRGPVSGTTVVLLIE